MITNLKTFLSKHSIAAAIIGLIGVIITALCALFGVILAGVFDTQTGEVAAMKLAIAATQTAETKLTLTAEALLVFTPTPTPTVPISTNTPTPMPISPSPSDTPTSTSLPPTVTFTPTSVPTVGVVHDTFNDNCVNTNLWSIFVESGEEEPNFLPTPTGPCWSLDNQGLSEKNDQITFTLTNTNQFEQSFYLVEQPKSKFTSVELDLTMENISGQWGGVGLFTRRADGDQLWTYYFIRFGGNGTIEKGHEIYQLHETIEDEGLKEVSQGTETTLELRWDGNNMYFYINREQSTMEPVTFPGFSDTFGIYWVIGPQSSIQGQIDEVRVKTIPK